MIYTPKQRALMRLWQRNELKRINLLEGSVSSGKTWVSLVLWAFWVHEMPDDPDCLYLMSGKSLTTLKRNCLLLLQTLVGESNFRFSISSKEGWLFGRHILLEGANDAQAETKIRGLTLQGAYADEATTLPRDFWTMLLSRLRREGAKLFATTNPDSPSHWLKTDYIDRKDELDFIDIKFLLDDNTTLPADYVANIKLEYTGVYYERFILGNWVMAEGLIYPMFEKAIGEAPASRAERYEISIDYGTQNAFAAYLWGKYDSVWWALKEYYYSGRDTGKQKTDKEYADDLDNFSNDFLNANGKIRVIVDPSAASFIAELRRRGRYAVIPADNDVIDGIRETASAIEQGKIKISSALENWKREAAGYVWDESSAEDRPIKIDDHAMDSTRYFVKTERIVVTKKTFNPIWNK